MPNNISSYLYSAEIYQEMNLFKEALKELESAYKIDSLDYRVFYNKAICLTKLYKFKEAIDIYTLIINNISKEPLFYVERANLYNKIRNKKQSCLDYRTALYNGSTTARDSIDKYCKGKF
jgi:tetratricopeptide (TPR) repeat protein